MVQCTVTCVLVMWGSVRGTIGLIRHIYSALDSDFSFRFKYMEVIHGHLKGHSITIRTETMLGGQIGQRIENPVCVYICACVASVYVFVSVYVLGGFEMGVGVG